MRYDRTSMIVAVVAILFWLAWVGLMGTAAVLLVIWLWQQVMG